MKMNTAVFGGLIILALTTGSQLQAQRGGRYGGDGHAASQEKTRDRSAKQGKYKAAVGRNHRAKVGEVHVYQNSPPLQLKKIAAGHGRRQVTVAHKRGKGRKRVAPVRPRQRNQKRIVVRPRQRYRPLMVRGRRYYHRQGAFFRWSSGGFIAVRAPIGALVASLPMGCLELVIGGGFYHYYDGVFYRRARGGYHVVEAPAGVYLSALPLGARLTIISGRRYRVLEGVYYRELPNGYIIEDPPAEPSRVPTPRPDTVYVDKMIHRIMVRNSNGSETPVDMEKVGENTWKGPRGELYQGLPGNKELRPVYGF